MTKKELGELKQAAFQSYDLLPALMVAWIRTISLAQEGDS